MATMKSVRTAAPGTIKAAEIQRPASGPRDLLVRVRACGICGTSAAFVQMGGMPLGPGGQMACIPLGHEPAGEVIKIGAAVAGLKTGDRVVVNPQAAPSGIIGCGRTLGGMSEYLLIHNAVAGKSVAIFPDDLPFEVATLNEPMAVARHYVNPLASPSHGHGRGLQRRAHLARGGDMAQLSGVRQVAVADVLPARLQTALAAGADTVIDSAREDVTTPAGRSARERQQCRVPADYGRVVARTSGIAGLRMTTGSMRTDLRAGVDWDRPGRTRQASNGAC